MFIGFRLLEPAADWYGFDFLHLRFGHRNFCMGISWQLSTHGFYHVFLVELGKYRFKKDIAVRSVKVP